MCILSLLLLVALPRFCLSWVVSLPTVFCMPTVHCLKQDSLKRNTYWLANAVWAIHRDGVVQLYTSKLLPKGRIVKQSTRLDFGVYGTTQQGTHVVCVCVCVCVLPSLLAWTNVYASYGRVCVFSMQAWPSRRIDT
jgi:hypothetical protein